MFKIAENVKINPWEKYQNWILKNKDKNSQAIISLAKIQNTFKKKYIMDSTLPDDCIFWVEKNCKVTSGEKKGQSAILLDWQKWYIYCMLGWKTKETKNKPSKRLVRETMLIVASGNGKTSFFAWVIAWIAYNSIIPDPQIFIAANAQRQAEIPLGEVEKLSIYNKNLGERTLVKKTNHQVVIDDGIATEARITALAKTVSSNEGIIPAIVWLDETHGYDVVSFAADLKKSVKRSDSLIIETSTMGMLRGGFLDASLEYARWWLDNSGRDDTYLPLIFENENVDEVTNARTKKEKNVFLKSNPSLGQTVDLDTLERKLAKAEQSEEEAATTFTKNFNVPQRPITAFFTNEQCKAKTFDEDDIFLDKQLAFIGIDFAPTRSKKADLTCVSFLIHDIKNDCDYFKDFYFLPEFLETKKGNDVVKNDAVKLKSRYDDGIAYDANLGVYGYQKMIDQGHMILAPGETGIRETYIFDFIMSFIAKKKLNIAKIGCDPNRAANLMIDLEKNLPKTDMAFDTVIKFQMENRVYTIPVLDAMKKSRDEGRTFCNNPITTLHFSNCQRRVTAVGERLVSSESAKKDGVIAQMAAKSACMAFTRNTKTGAANSRVVEAFFDKLVNKKNKKEAKNE